MDANYNKILVHVEMHGSFFFKLGDLRLFWTGTCDSLQ